MNRPLTVPGSCPLAYKGLMNDKGRQLMKIRKAIIPAAGLGTRFLPATKAQAKGNAADC